MTELGTTVNCDECASEPRRKRESALATILAVVIGRSPTPLLTALTAGLVAKLLMLAIALPIYRAFGESALTGFSGQFHGLDGSQVFLAVAFAPLLESLIVWLIVWILRVKLGAPLVPMAVICGVIHVGLHGLAPMSLSVFPVFAVHALILANWSDRGRSGTGYWTVVGAHAVQNGLTVVMAVLLV